MTFVGKENAKLNNVVLKRLFSKSDIDIDNTMSNCGILFLYLWLDLYLYPILSYFFSLLGCFSFEIELKIRQTVLEETKLF